MVGILIAAAFWAKVRRRKGRGCWMWKPIQPGRTKTYGTVEPWMAKLFGTGVASRVAWLLTYGPIPPGMLVCHRCDRPGCVRPDHLFIGTHADNSADMVAKGRQCDPSRDPIWMIEEETGRRFRGKRRAK